MNNNIVSGTLINRLHALVVFSAFSIALLLACKLHYLKVVKNAHFGYPHEWIPSVSASIGDRFPERNIFQLLMALAAILRMALLILSSAQLKRFKARFGSACFWVGFARMWLAGAWIYFPSGDWNNFHDVSMILYLFCTAAYHKLLIKAKQSVEGRLLSIKTSRHLLLALALEVPMLVHWFVMHKVFRRAGAYSIYALFEWLLIIIDIGLDYFAFTDLLSNVSLALMDTEKDEHLM